MLKSNLEAPLLRASRLNLVRPLPAKVLPQFAY